MIRRLFNSIVALWDRFTRLSGRSLRPTTSGKWILALALSVGFAAMNTGNNLLFFGWGLVLSSIVISGILSESTLRAASAAPLPADELRAGTRGVLPVVLENTRKVPAFGVAISLDFEGRVETTSSGPERVSGGPKAAPEDGATSTGTTFELRLSPGARKKTKLAYTPRARGDLRVRHLRVSTAAPFGFFEKVRIVEGHRLPAGTQSILALPERVDTTALGHALWARLGEAPAGQAGAGDELFSLRPFREGDDPRRIAWRRVAKTGRLVVREHEATRSRELLVALRVRAGASYEEQEDGIATAASLIEDLLADGHSVGASGPGVLVPPSSSPRQRLACLQALARLRVEDESPTNISRGAAVIVVAVGGGEHPDAEAVVRPLPRRRGAYV